MPSKPLRYLYRVGPVAARAAADLQRPCPPATAQVRRSFRRCVFRFHRCLFGSTAPPVCLAVLFPVPGPLAKPPRPMTVLTKVNAS